MTSGRSIKFIFPSLSLQDGAKATNPFASDAPAASAPADNSNTPNILDLFGMQDAPAAASEVSVQLCIDQDVSILNYRLRYSSAINYGRVNYCYFSD